MCRENLRALGEKNPKVESEMMLSRDAGVFIYPPFTLLNRKTKLNENRLLLIKGSRRLFNLLSLQICHPTPLTKLYFLSLIPRSLIYLNLR